MENLFDDDEDDDVLVVGSEDQFLKRMHLRDVERDDDTAMAAEAMLPECGGARCSRLI